MGLRVWSGGEIFSKKKNKKSWAHKDPPPPIITKVKKVNSNYLNRISAVIMILIEFLTFSTDFFLSPISSTRRTSFSAFCSTKCRIEYSNAGHQDPNIFWVTQKWPQICTVILRIRFGRVAWFAEYICGNFWVSQYHNKHRLSIISRKKIDNKQIKTYKVSRKLLQVLCGALYRKIT